LPRRLEPMDRLPLRVRFTPNRPGEIGAALTVASGTRCAKLVILGEAFSAISDDQLITHSPEVLDFGLIAPAKQATQNVLFSIQSGAERFRTIELSIGSPNAQFFSVDKSSVPTKIDGCARFQVPVTFLGSASPTTVSDGLFWEVASTSNSGVQFIGLQMVELFATVRQ
jgi:hypothetical protein